AGFTLAEILVVVAVLAILFSLLFVPLMRALGFIHTSSVRVGVQNVARVVFETLTREISDATYIYDNEDDPSHSSLIFVLRQGAGGNLDYDPTTGGAPVPTAGAILPPLLVPGPGPDYGVTTPRHVHYGLMLSRAMDAAGRLLPYHNEWELDSPDLRGGAAGPAIGAAPPVDNLYRIFRAEYFTDPNPVTGPAAPFNLRNCLGVMVDFRDPGALVDDSLYPRRPGHTVPMANSPQTANYRRRLELSGLLVGLTPRQDVDVVWGSFSPQTNSWSVTPGFRIRSFAVQNEALDPVRTGGTPYPTGYRADFGHWQTVRRKDWAHPAFGTAQAPVPWARFFQTFDVQVTQRYSDGNRHREYYVSCGRKDSTPDTWDPALPQQDYFVFRKADPTRPDPAEGPWPAEDVPVFNMTRYMEKIKAWRQRVDEDPVSFWNNNNPYDTRLLPATDTEPYWPEMAFLVDANRGTVEFRIDPPVRDPNKNVNEPQPIGPLAPFQIPFAMPGDPDYVPGPDGSRADWVIPDVYRARTSTARDARGEPIWNNGDQARNNGFATTWIRIPTESVRVSVGIPKVAQPSAPTDWEWVPYTRVSTPGDVGRREFWFDEETGHIAFDPNNYASDWANHQYVKIRVWYQIQTNVQRRGPDDSLDSADGHAMTASYFTKELLNLTLALRAYDSQTGRAQTFQLNGSVRPRNLQ
ncbi:MAG: prepilin-type N-terminal cleavage/methylation domain-containing protein, partial [Armatimonadota bacterium]|nr:prepilin-type N-terminal cleavage/methylation domain-containing protein [Armatimonadota bacterium]